MSILEQKIKYQRKKISNVIWIIFPPKKADCLQSLFIYISDVSGQELNRKWVTGSFKNRHVEWKKPRFLSVVEGLWSHCSRRTSAPEECFGIVIVVVDDTKQKQCYLVTEWLKCFILSFWYPVTFPELNSVGSWTNSARETAQKTGFSCEILSKTPLITT